MDKNYEDMAPINQMDDLCKLLTGIEYDIHRHDEGEYRYLKEDAICITAINPYTGQKMYIDLEEEFTVSFDAYHAHYDPDSYEYGLLVQFIKQLLNNELCVVTLYCQKDREWLGSTTCSREEAQRMPIKQLFSHVYKTREFKNKLTANGGTAEFVFWNPQDNVIKVIEARQEKEDTF